MVEQALALLQPVQRVQCCSHVTRLGTGQVTRNLRQSVESFAEQDLQ
jgi:hypothetical protein